TIQLYINNLPDGVYIIQLNTQHKSAVLKFVKQE
ncbi:MAG: T9SS type A sorting domain-containing protein, partial [Bacteroidetes bacterium]|nr:T9SS type A sorting domain-containing protein [Bacteroidota bacterium]